jgi:DnaJ-class molecular chaperone
MTFDEKATEETSQKPPGDETEPSSPQSAEGLCPACAGTGKLGRRTCPDCGGSGTITVIVGDA